MTTELFNRELSWLEFNQRVLEEAGDPSVPLLERLFFLGVVGSNLDEFFMVRMGGLHLQCAAGLTRLDPLGLTPPETLRRVRDRARRQMAEQQVCLLERVLPGLAARRIELSVGRLFSTDDIRLLAPTFETELFPVLTPVAVDNDTPFPLLSPLAVYLAVRLSSTAADQPARHALLRLGPGLPRVWRLPAVGSANGPRQFVLLEDLVRAFLGRLLPGQTVEEAVAFRVTRNADIAVDEEYAADLSTAMGRVLRERKTGPCVRLELESAASEAMEGFLSERLAVDRADIFRLNGPMDLAGLRDLREQVAERALCYPDWTPRNHPALDLTRDLFEQLAHQDILLATPYESFDPMVRLVEAAASDEQVRAIKIVLYRAGSRSPLIRALALAAQNGKHVTAMVELKARFDEARNIGWAKDLEEAGVQVVYGVRLLKTHAKVCLIIRREDDGIRHYMHFGTGNYNAATARQYTDAGLFTCDPLLGRDATVFFHALTGYSEPQTYRKLVQAPSGLRDRLLELIRYEAAQAENRQPARIAAKLNALVDPELIEALYAASCKGVEIRLCVRGICCLKPGVKGLSENIVVTSVVDRFLEHSRLLYFLHGGQHEVFLSSADWMPRNLDRRVELLVPVTDPGCRRRALELLDTCLADNVKAWQLRPDGSYVRVSRPHGQRPIHSQTVLCERAAAAVAQSRRNVRTVFEPHLPRGGRPPKSQLRRRGTPC